MLTFFTNYKNGFVDFEAGMIEDANRLVVPFVSFFVSIPEDDVGQPFPFEVDDGNSSFETLELAQGSIPKSYCPSFLFVELLFDAFVFPKMS